jgi:hypothetical protein
MKISSSPSNPTIAGQPKRYTSNIRRSKDRKARSDSHNSTEELTESLLRNCDEEEGNGGYGDDEEEEVILNNRHPVQVSAYPNIVSVSRQTEKGKRREVEGEGKGESNGERKQKKGKKKTIPVVDEKVEEVCEVISNAQDHEEREEIQFPISSFEVEDPEDRDSYQQQGKKQKKKSYLSGKPLIGMYDRAAGVKRGDEGGSSRGEVKKDTLASRWLQAQQPKHNEIFNQQDSIEHYNVDRSDGNGNSNGKKNLPPLSGSQLGTVAMSEGEAYDTLLDKHFAHSTAVRHFNESMPVRDLLFSPSPQLISHHLVWFRFWCFPLASLLSLEHSLRVIPASESNQQTGNCNHSRSSKHLFMRP